MAGKPWPIERRLAHSETMLRRHATPGFTDKLWSGYRGGEIPEGYADLYYELRAGKRIVSREALQLVKDAAEKRAGRDHGAAQAGSMQILPKAVHQDGQDRPNEGPCRPEE